MADFPKCRYCKKPYTLAREEPGTEGWWEFKCETCKIGHVYSKPSAQLAARYRTRVAQAIERQKMIRQWEQLQRTYSFPTQTKTPKEIT